MNNKFDFNEIVKVISDNSEYEEINGFLGVIRGMAQNEETGMWSYGVSIYKKEGMIWRIKEKNLISTNQKAKPDEFTTGEIVKVRVNPKTGEGEIIEDD